MNILYYVIAILASLFLALGIYMLFSYINKLPTAKTEKTIDTIVELDNIHQKSFIGSFVGGVSKKLILPIVKLSETNKYNIDKALKYLRYDISAEQHCANSIVFGVIIGLLLCLLAIIHPAFILFGLIMGYLIYKLEFEKPIKDFDNIRESIDVETAQLAKFIADALKDGNRNVINILISCKESVSKNFRKELEYTITEMKTGNQEKALMNMSARMSSPNITQIVTGLIGVLKGNDQTIYFEALAEKFKKAELTYIRKKNSTKPGNISKLSIVLILAVVGQIMVGIILTLLDQINESGFF